MILIVQFQALDMFNLSWSQLNHNTEKLTYLALSPIWPCVCVCVCVCVCGWVGVASSNVSLSSIQATQQQQPHHPYVSQRQASSEVWKALQTIIYIRSGGCSCFFYVERWTNAPRTKQKGVGDFKSET